MDDIIKFGSVRRGTIRGIQLQPMTPQIAAELGAPTPRRPTSASPVIRCLRGRPPPVRHHRQLHKTPIEDAASSSGCSATPNRQHRRRTVLRRAASIVQSRSAARAPERASDVRWFPATANCQLPTPKESQAKNGAQPTDSADPATPTALCERFPLKLEVGSWELGVGS